MNKRGLVIILIVIAVLASGTWLVLSAIEPAKNTNQTPQVKISDLKSTGNWETPGGVQAILLFNITIRNLQNRDAGNLTVEVNMLDVNGSVLDSSTNFFGPGVIGYGAALQSFDGTLHPGEVRELRGIIMTNWGEVGQVDSLIAQVKYGNVILDELKFT